VVTKTELAIQYFQQGEIGKALKILSKFHGFSKEEQRCLQIASECYSGNSLFYESLGIDVEKIISEATACIEKSIISTTNIAPKIMKKSA
jgi:hypothetical protein